MPFRARDVFVGKILPYFVVAAINLGIIAHIGIAPFDVPFRGSPWVLALGAVEFLFVMPALVCWSQSSRRTRASRSSSR
jgi:ABC-2 type transport system permease protein